MKLTLQQYEEVQKYLDGEMLPDERKKFVLMLDKDPALQSYVKFEQALRSDVDAINEKNEILASVESAAVSAPSYEGYADMRNLLSEARNELTGLKKMQDIDSVNIESNKQAVEKPRDRIVNWRAIFKLTAAAGVIAALAITALWFFYNRNARTNIAQHNKTVPASTGPVRKPQPDTVQSNPNPSVRSSGHEGSDSNLPATGKKEYADNLSVYKSFYSKDTSVFDMPAILDSMPGAYNRNNYAIIQKLDLDELPVSMGAEEVDGKQNVMQMGHYYKGLASMEVNDFSPAVKNFQWIMENSKNSQLVHKSQWYAALAYIRLDNPRKAVPLLKSVAASPSTATYHTKAKQLLDMLAR